MKRLWLIVGTLSITGLVQADVATQGIEPECHRYVKGPNGFDVIELSGAHAAKCGWATFQKIFHTESGGKGSNNFVRLANVKDPSKVFYLATPNKNRSLNFSGTQQVACYECTNNTSCDPNGSESKEKCFTKGALGYIECDKQVNCSNVAEITSCYKLGEGQMDAQYNDLDLCVADETNGKGNYSGAGKDAYQAQDVASSVVAK